MAEPHRVVGVTLGLMGLGALAGAACGAAIPPGVVLLTGHLRDLLTPDVARLMALGAGFGAVVGGVAGPAVAWGLLRHVSLGKAVLWAAAGTVAGALVGEFLAPFNPYSRVMPGVIAGGLAGLLAASAALRLLAGRATPRAPVPKPPNVR
jgi:hypothetical protein